MATEEVRPLYDDSRIDGWRLFKSEGICPKYTGSFHVHHRIDGVLFAVNVWDITETTLGSVYTFYDPDYQFLAIEAITSVREIEYMKRIRREFMKNMRYYYVSGSAQELQRNIFKEAMNPKYILCPFT